MDKPYYIVTTAGGSYVTAAQMATSGRDGFVIDGDKAAFSNGKEAAAMQSVMTRATGRNWRVIKIDPSKVDWRERETLRFGSGHYKATPWHNESWYKKLRDQHFAHLSFNRPGLIAYTQNEDKGRGDIQTPIKPGVYLKTFFSDILSEAEIEMWAAKVAIASGTHGLTITQDPKVIRDVYTNGPSSCMSGRASDFNTLGTNMHPAEIYAGPDLAVAFLGNQKNATARAVVWPEKRRWTGKMYGDHAKLATALRAEGYSPGSPEGARLRKVEVIYTGQPYLIMPYLDNVTHGEDEGEFLRIKRGGFLVFSSQSGNVRGDRRPRCDECQQRITITAGSYKQSMAQLNDTGRKVCLPCAAKLGAAKDDYTGHWYQDQTVLVPVHTGAGKKMKHIHRSVIRDAPVRHIVRPSGDIQIWDRACTMTCNQCQQLRAQDDFSKANSPLAQTVFGGGIGCDICLAQKQADDPIGIELIRVLGTIAAGADRLVSTARGRQALLGGALTDALYRLNQYGTPYSSRLSSYDRLVYETPPRKQFNKTLLGKARARKKSIIERITG